MFCLGFTKIKMEKEMTLQDFKTNIHKATESCQQVLQQSHDQVHYILVYYYYKHTCNSTCRRIDIEIYAVPIFSLAYIL